MNKRLSVVFFLGFSSGLPLALLTSTLRAWWSDAGLSLAVIASLSLLNLPYAYRMIWGPFLDKLTLLPLGKRRSWIVCCAFLMFVGFNIIARLSPVKHTHLLIILTFIIACLSSIQDAAIDAHRTEYLPEREHGLGASLAVLGYRLALLIGGGLALLVAHRFGWSSTYHLMATFFLIGIIAILASDEPAHPTLPPQNLIKCMQAALKNLWHHQNIWGLLGFIIFYKLGEAFTTSTSSIVMPFLIQGLGFSLDTIGVINKVLGLIAIILGGVISGFILTHRSLFKCLLWFGLLQALTNGLFLLLAFSGKNVGLLALAVMLDNFAAGMGSTALVVMFMRIVDKRFTATQLSFLVAIATLPRIFIGPIAAYIQLKIGWVGLYEVAWALSFGYLPFLYVLKNSLIGRHPKFALSHILSA